MANIVKCLHVHIPHRCQYTTVVRQQIQITSKTTVYFECQSDPSHGYTVPFKTNHVNTNRKKSSFFFIITFLALIITKMLRISLKRALNIKTTV